MNQNANLKSCIENIDIGGPNLIRAAAKNFEDVIGIVNPEDYDQIINEFKKNGNISLETRKRLAVEAFKITANYDSYIHDWLKKV